MLFNPDMDQRLADLQTAVTSGAVITAQFHAPFEHSGNKMPARILVDVRGSDRRLVFDVPTAQGVAGQLEVNGLGEAAGVIRSAVPA